MGSLQSLFFFDLSSAFVMIIMAYLSKRLGEALKIRPYYKILFATALIILSATGLDIVAGSISLSSVSLISVSLRFFASLTAFFTCLKYWNWLFSEFLKS